MSELDQEKEQETGVSDEKFEWPEDHFKDLDEGQIIEAKVIIVRDDAAFVDIGGKSDLVIPLAELSNEPATSAKELVKVGDVIKVMVTRSGGEDRILLSKRLVDQEQKWFQLEEVFKSGKTISGKVTQTVNAGLNVDIDGIRAFMPASQSGLKADLESLVGQTFPVKILEYDRAKKRVLVSRRVLLEEERQKAETAFFSTVQEGERRNGRVTRITNFGAFVDLGSGVEGLIHVSEMSWFRVKSPRDVLKEDDQVEVIVTKVDPAMKRISLSLKQLQSHPWDQAISQFKEDSIYPGTVVRMESFGAFVRLAPEVDGLVHI
ncbi:MAG TPA: bifunctional 4-hydroxy-3-methylbut-2-enyl diphosphate reductase/30S ribosomal protein S1, partial [Firmicutes bacterium]|nr:bifunctional 4-hydroxy-3-methylbut-2-enyl diphosphate reductase/30S ribosomal protein S1 [Bacillota bacterium]